MKNFTQQIQQQKDNISYEKFIAKFISNKFSDLSFHLLSFCHEDEILLFLCIKRGKGEKGKRAGDSKI